MRKRMIVGYILCALLLSSFITLHRYIRIMNYETINPDIPERFESSTTSKWFEYEKIDENLTLDGSAEDVFVVGDYAYLADGPGGLEIYDLENNTCISAFDDGGDSNGVYVQGSYAYVIDEYDGLEVIDVSNPRKPKLVACIPSPGMFQRRPDYIMDIEILGNYAYIAYGHWGLAVADISNPLNPTYLWLYQNSGGFCNGVHATEEIIYFTDLYNGLTILNVSDPLHPILMNKTSIGYLTRDVYVVDDIAYVTSHGRGLVVLDVSNRSYPVEIGNSTGLNGFDIYVSNGLVYITGGRFVIANVSDPSNIYLIYSSSYGQEMFVVGNIVYLACRWDGFRIVDVTDPFDPIWLEYYPNRYGRSIWIQDDYLYITCLSQGMMIFNITNPIKPIQVGYFDDSFLFHPAFASVGIHLGLGDEIYVSGDYAYIASDRLGLEIVNVSDPTNPELVSIYAPWTINDLPDGFYNRAQALHIFEDVAYVLYEATGIHIVNISDLSNPELITTYRGGLSFQDIDAQGDYAYICPRDYSDNKIYVLNVSNPADPVEVLQLNFSAREIIVSGNYAYTISGSGFFYFNVYNITDLTNVIKICSKPIGWSDTVGSLEIFGEYAYVAGHNSLSVFDISNPMNATEVGSFADGGMSYDSFVWKDYIYVADGTDFLQILKIGNDLVLNLTLDEGSGINTADYSVYENHGRIYGAEWLTGLTGTALSFVGGEDYVDCGNAHSFDITEVITIEAWIYAPISTESRTILSKWYNNGIEDPSYKFELTSDSKLQMVLHLDSLDISLCSENQVPRNKWVYVVGTYNGTHMSLYIDGEIANQIPAAGLISISSAPVFIGAHNSSNQRNNFYGLIDEICLYSRALDSSEIESRYGKHSSTTTTTTTTTESTSTSTTTEPSTTDTSTTTIVSNSSSTTTGNTTGNESIGWVQLTNLAIGLGGLGLVIGVLSVPILIRKRYLARKPVKKKTPKKKK